MNAFFSGEEHHSEFSENILSGHAVSQTSIDYIPIFKNIASIFSAIGIIADIYNLVMFIIFKRIYLASNPLHQQVMEDFGSGTFLESFG